MRIRHLIGVLGFAVGLVLSAPAALAGGYGHHHGYYGGSYSVYPDSYLLYRHWDHYRRYGYGYRNCYPRYPGPLQYSYPRYGGYPGKSYLDHGGLRLIFSF